MGLSRTNAPAEQGEVVKASIIVEKISQPFIVAAKKYHQENPKKFLDLMVILVFMIFSFIGEALFRLPWEWYVAFSLLIVGYFDIFDKITILIKKKSNGSKKNKQG